MKAFPEDDRTRSDFVPANNTGVSGDICTVHNDNKNMSAELKLSEHRSSGSYPSYYHTIGVIMTLLIACLRETGILIIRNSSGKNG